MKTNQTIPTWRYQGSNVSLNLPDPRFAIARHIDWTRPAWGIGLTSYSVPEPDNFNYALYAQRPIECDFINSQVWYRDTKNNWYSVYRVEVHDKPRWLAWSEKQDWIGHWHSWGTNKLRRQKTLLEQEVRKSKHVDFTVNERLFTMNVYDSLKYKCDNESIVNQRIGQPMRPLLLPEDQDPVME